VQKDKDEHTKMSKTHETAKTILARDRETLQKEQQQLEMDKKLFETQAASVTKKNNSSLNKILLKNTERTYRYIQKHAQGKEETPGVTASSSFRQALGVLLSGLSDGLSNTELDNLVSSEQEP